MTTKRRKTKPSAPKKTSRIPLTEPYPEKSIHEDGSSVIITDSSSNKKKSDTSKKAKTRTEVTNDSISNEIVCSPRKTRSMKNNKKYSKNVTEETPVLSLSILLDSEEVSLVNDCGFNTDKCNISNDIKIKPCKKVTSNTQRYIKSTVQTNPFKRIKRVENNIEDENPKDELPIKDVDDFNDNDSHVTKKMKLVSNDCEVINDKDQSPDILNFNHCEEKIVEHSTPEEVNLEVPNLDEEKENYEQNNLFSVTREDSECSSFPYPDNESSFIELDEITVEELEPALDGVFEEEIKQKYKLDDIRKNQVNDETSDAFKSTGISPGIEISEENIKDDVSKNLCNASLQAVVESFINSPQYNCERDVKALKNGLCQSWLLNNYVCHNPKCEYTHNAYELFINKLRRYSSKFVMVLISSMRDDILFVDIIMAALQLLSQRKVPTTWVTFLVFFVFYVTEPSDYRFLNFWTKAARFFCQLNSNYSGAKGFPSVLSIFSLCEKSEEWKIIEFVKLLKLPPIQIRATFALLEPILKLDIPDEFLIEAIQMCIETQEDVVKVYLLVVPKLSVMTLPIQVVEQLLHLSKSLEAVDENNYAENLKKRLQSKVEKFKIKVVEQIFPLTAAFQKEVAHKICSEDVQTKTLSGNVSNDNEKNEEDLETLNFQDNYFIPKNTFVNSIIKALSLNLNVIPTTYEKTPTFPVVGDNVPEKATREDQITQIKQLFSNCQFETLGKFLNELREDVLLQAAEVFTKLLFQMKISLQQVVDLVKLMLSSCQNEHSATVISCVSVTLVLNLVKINEWEKAYTLVTLCEEKKVNLVGGMVFASNDLISITQFRIALLLIEIYMYKENYQQAFSLIRKYNLFSSNQSIWKLEWKEKDKCIRVKILEEFLCEIVSRQMTKMAFDTFVLIRGNQEDLNRPIELQRFVNEILTLLLNQDNEKAISLFENLKHEVLLTKNTVRAIIITLVRHNKSLMAKNLLMSYNQNIYRLPDINYKSITVTISSFWLEEEIFIIFDLLFDEIADRYFFNNQFKKGKHIEFEVLIKITRDEVPSSSCHIPLCLGLINPSYDHTYLRIDRVLQHQFNPPISLNTKYETLKLHSDTLQQHIFARQAIRNQQ